MGNLSSSFGKRMIKGYELRERVGAGGFGAVYRAFQTSVGREVAIKMILPEHANQPDFVRRFDIEAQLIARLEHPHIVPLYDYWRDPEGAFLVMRWLRGNLRASLQRGAWSPESAARLLDQIASALMVAHREGIIHRDIKPDNVLLDEDDNAYLADFGIAKDTNVVNFTDQGTLLGSPAYLTPEQIKGEVLTPRVDIYSLGLVLYELLVSEQPYADARTPAELISRQLTMPIPLVRTRRPQLPAAIDEVLQTATAKNPEHRYATVIRFASAFRASLPNQQRMVNQPLVEALTERELDILRLIVEGQTINQIAERLVLSIATVRWYTKQIYAKLDVHSRQQAVVRAMQLKLFTASNEAILPALVPLDADVAAPIKTDIQVNSPEVVNPYRGLQPFQETDAPFFFGRAALTEHLLGRLTASDDGARFLAIVGPSGSGKSSVVKAGLVPALRKGGLPNSDRWFITEMMPGTHPLEELEAALLRVSINPLPGLLDQLSKDRRGLVRAAKRLLPVDPTIELVLIIDQTEELFTLVEDEATRLHFIDNLLNAATDARGRVRLVLTLRADFYDRPLLYPRLAELMRSHIEVMIPLTASELERAIVGPAEQVGLKLEAGLLSTIIKDVGEQPGTLPLLQYALAELYERRQGRLLTLDAYREAGGLSGALARRADDLYSNLDEEGQAAARQLFMRLVTLGEGVEDTRRRTLQAELDSMMLGNRAIDDVISSYAQFRLLTFDHDPITRGPTVEIAHEALIREWGRLRKWLSESREDLRTQRRLMTAATEWLRSGEDVSYLASGARLIQFEAIPESSLVKLNSEEAEYLRRSSEHHKRIERLERERIERELELGRQAREALKTSEMLRVAGLASALVPHNEYDAELAALLAIRSLKTGYSAVADATLLNAIELIHAEYEWHSNPLVDVYSVVFDSTDRHVVLALTDGTILKLDLDSSTEKVLMKVDSGTYVMEFSRDAQFVVALCTDDTVRIYRIDKQQEVLRISGLPNNSVVPFVTISPDNKYCYIGGLTSPLGKVIDLEKGKVVHEFSDYGIPAVFSPDGQFLAICNGSKDQVTVKCFDLIHGYEAEPFRGHTSFIRCLQFSPDGRFLVTGGNDTSIRLWDVGTRKEIRRFLGHRAAAELLAFSHDGKTLVTASPDGTIRLWEVATGIEKRVIGISAPSRCFVLSQNDKQLAAVNKHGVYIFNADLSRLDRHLIGHTRGLFRVQYTPDGEHILTCSDIDSEPVRLWNARTGELEMIYEATEVAVIAPDGNTFASTQWHGTTVSVYDLHTGTILRRFPEHKGQTYPVSYSRDGQLIATVDLVGIHIWLANTGELVREIGNTVEDWATFVDFSLNREYIVTGTFYGYGMADVYSVNTGKKLFSFPNRGIAKYSPDGAIIAVVNMNATDSIALYDATNGLFLREFGKGKILSFVNDIAFSPDSTLLVVADWANNASLWKVETGEYLRRVKHNAGVRAVAFSPDGKQVVSGGEDNQAMIWDVDYLDTINYACTRIVHDLTDEQRIAYGITDNEPTCPKFG